MKQSLNIQRKLLLLALSVGLMTFLAVGTIAFWAMDETRSALLTGGENLQREVSGSVANFAEEQAKTRIREVTAAKAKHFDYGLSEIEADVRFMAQDMSNIMSHQPRYSPRSLTVANDVPDIMLGTAYLHLSPDLLRHGISGNLRREIGVAANFADTLLNMSRFYHGYSTSFIAASQNGYMICVDIGRQDGISIYPDEDARTAFLTTFDARERPWYQQAAQNLTEDVTYSEPYLGTDGQLSIACATPYYDASGFAGVAAITYGIEDLYREQVENGIGDVDTCFVLDEEGDVVLSQRSGGVLAADHARQVGSA